MIIDFVHSERTTLKKGKFGELTRLVRSHKGGVTYAVEKIPTDAFNVGDEIELNIGMAKCHENENFSKKIGRELAISRMKLEKFKVTRIVLTENRVDVCFKNENFEVDLSFKDDKKFSRLEHVYRE